MTSGLAGDRVVIDSTRATRPDTPFSERAFPSTFELVTVERFSRLTTSAAGCKVFHVDCHEYITADPAVLVGKPVIRGTRVAVEFVLGLIAQGWPEQEITCNYRLTPEQVRACVAYAQERLSEEKVFAVS